MITIVKSLGKGKCIGKCDCGTVKEFLEYNIKSGKSKSCGCSIRKPQVPKDVKRTFNLMRYRCNTPTSSDYKNWGAKGIKVLYKDVFEFYADVGDKPSKAHTIDRINFKGNYEIGNCRWATQKEQSRNKNINVIIEHNGESKCVAEWAEEYGIKYTTLKERIKRGWSFEDCINKEVNSTCHSKTRCNK